MKPSTNKNKVCDKLGRGIRDLRVSVTNKCNFRCPYCMPADEYDEEYVYLPHRELLTFEEIVRITRLFIEQGAVKLRLTGGEPLLRNGFVGLVALLSKVEGIKDLALTTNGYFLGEMAKTLKDAGLQRITVSLNTLDDNIFKQLSGTDYCVETVLKGIRKAEEAGFHQIKINAIVQRGINDHTIVDLARHFKGTGHIVRFIEYMDVGNMNGWKPEQVVSAEEIFERINAEMPLEPVEPNYKGEVAQRYRYLNGSGEIGIIASITKPFCGDCARVRLSLDGKIYTCLFATSGTDLKGPMRKGAGDDDIRDLIKDIWSRRSDRYSEERADIAAKKDKHKKIEMYQIGG